MLNRTLVLLLLVLALACGTVQAATLHFPINAFTIDALEGTSDTGTYQVLTMALPPTPDLFTPNITVMVQPTEETFDEHFARSLDEIKSIGLTMMRVKSDENTATYEYEGMLLGMRLRWYSKAIMVDSKVYIITATASNAHWAQVSEQLLATVESFRLD